MGVVSRMRGALGGAIAAAGDVLMDPLRHAYSGALHERPLRATPALAASPLAERGTVLGAVRVALDDLVPRLHAARAAAGVPLACARSGDWRHPVVGLWPVDLRADLRRAVVAEGLRKIEVWTARHGVAIADWPASPVDPFFNVNTPADAAEADRIATQYAEA